MGWKFECAQDESGSDISEPFTIPDKPRIVLGPPMAWFTDQNGERCIYKQFKIGIQVSSQDVFKEDYLFRKCMKLWLDGIRSAVVLRIMPEGNFISETLYGFYLRFYSRHYDGARQQFLVENNEETPVISGKDFLNL